MWLKTERKSSSFQSSRAALEMSRQLAYDVNEVGLVKIGFQTIQYLDIIASATIGGDYIQLACHEHDIGKPSPQNRFLHIEE
jgi:hypothetical protein